MSPDVREELAAMEAGTKDVTSDVHLLNAFGRPDEYRTMSRLDKMLLMRLAIVETKGKFRNSALREAYVKNIFLMMRSQDGWGSEQMVRVAIAKKQDEEKKGLLSMFQPWGKKDEGSPP